ncbi:uncharacterized protein BX664DRAFT_381242 [Halteromyces radiatus]|uniref:uncharacterized protein n=1 Tax=Halteromyces radiatus TaxID=101107 RepID=UPI00221F88BD|nr:uncharacterized protein BX664DRAFT_381242 [Halteromyces radiatus]KAI8098538.1 hypothetical protein BX664DRAFT_381242 [Halteromyces radiatus]
MNSLNVSLSRLKLQIAQAVLEQDRLQHELNTLDESNQNQCEAIQHALTTLNNNLDGITNDYLQRARRKQLKINKHKAWRKRRKERLKSQQSENKSQEPVLNMTRDTMEEKKKEIEQSSKTKEIGQQPPKLTRPKNVSDQQQRVQQLTIVVDKLLRLRDLRRKKLETKGHFFPETGDTFYNTIKAAAEEEEEKEKEEQDWIEHNMNEQQTIKPHPEDTWKDQPLDMDAYNYWLQGWQDVEKLRYIRQQWDQYVVSEVDDGSLGSNNGLKIPPSMVSPSPPSNAIWASYLVD